MGLDWPSVFILGVFQEHIGGGFRNGSALHYNEIYGPSFFMLVLRKWTFFPMWMKLMGLQIDFYSLDVFK
jgi:hypothetical protein